MINYVQLTFIPGSAGNFFGRTLNLLSNSYGFLDPNRPIPTNLTEKFQQFSYLDVADKTFDQRNWVDFERKLVHHSEKIDMQDLPKDSYSIWLDHYFFDQGYNGNQKTYKIAIDPTNAFEWAILNAFYKNSYQDVKWLIKLQEQIKRSDVLVIDLAKLIDNVNDFIVQWHRAVNFIDKKATLEEEEAAIKLWHEWQRTVLQPKDFVTFKTRIGWNL